MHASLNLPPANLRAYHAYCQYPHAAPPEYPSLTVLAQVCSALHHAAHTGPVTLCANAAHAASLDRYGALAAYDEVNLTALDALPADPRYWSLAKLYAARLAATRPGPFLLLDTDAWVRRWPAQANWRAGLLGLHRETAAADSRVYAPPLELLPGTDAWPWQQPPINGALLYFNDERLVPAWQAAADHVLQHNKGLAVRPASQDTLFVEQRLLPVLATRLGLAVDVLVPSSFNPDHVHFADAWTPALDSSDYLQDCQQCVRHIWENKRHYDEPAIRQGTLAAIISDLAKLPTDLALYRTLIRAAQSECS